VQQVSRDSASIEKITAVIHAIAEKQSTALERRD